MTDKCSDCGKGIPSDYPKSCQPCISRRKDEALAIQRAELKAEFQKFINDKLTAEKHSPPPTNKGYKAGFHNGRVLLLEELHKKVEKI